MSKSRKRYRRSSKQDSAWGFLILGLIGIFWNNLVAGEPWAIALVVIIVLICMGILWILLRKYFMKTPAHSITLKEIDKMTGREFEIFVDSLYTIMGYKTELTPASNDYGADVIAIRHEIKTVIQVKNYKNPVGYGAVEQVNTAKGIYKADEAMIVTSSPSFTAQAQRAAKALRIELIARDELEKLIKKHLPSLIKTEKDITNK
jgi:restriction system protein